MIGVRRKRVKSPSGRVKREAGKKERALPEAAPEGPVISSQNAMGSVVVAFAVTATPVASNVGLPFVDATTV